MKFEFNNIEKVFKPFILGIRFEEPTDVLMFLRYFKQPDESKRHPIMEDILANLKLARDPNFSPE